MPASLVLASGSPRRRELLEAAGISFVTAVPDVEESASPSLSLREVTTCNATRKGAKIAREYPAKVVLAADTLVALRGEIIGKPADLDEARKTLRRLSGQTHEVCTSVFIASASTHHVSSFSVFSDVQFHLLTDEAIERYISEVDPLDKAGAYAAQGRGAEVIRRIDGSYTNVVGLPMDETIAALRGFGI